MTHPVVPLKLIWKDRSKISLLSFSAASANAGFFGIPVSIALFTPAVTNLVILSTMGFIVYQLTIGFFLLEHSHLSTRSSLLEITRLPSLYAFVIGLLMNHFSLPLPPEITLVLHDFQGSYAILGVLLLGMSLSHIHRLKVDADFLGLGLIAKFLVWPIAIAAILVLFSVSPDLEKALVLLAALPVATNTVTLAHELHIHPDKASLIVVTSTLLSALAIPLAGSLLLR